MSWEENRIWGIGSDDVYKGVVRDSNVRVVFDVQGPISAE